MRTERAALPPSINLLLESQQGLNPEAKERLYNLFGVINILPKKQGWFSGFNPENADFLETSKAVSSLFQVLHPYKDESDNSYAKAYQNFWSKAKEDISLNSFGVDVGEIWDVTIAYARKKIYAQVDRITRQNSSEEDLSGNHPGPSIWSAAEAASLTLTKAAVYSIPEVTPDKNPFSFMMGLYLQGFIGMSFETNEKGEHILALYHQIAKDCSYALGKLDIDDKGVIRSYKEVAWEDTDLREKLN